MRRSLSPYRVTKMQIKALWGFRGDAPKLKSSSADVKAGDVFPDVDPEYGHALVGKGLVEQIHEGAAPQETKPAQPSELKAGEDGGAVGPTSTDEATPSAGAQITDGGSPDGGAVAGSASESTAGTPTSSDHVGADKKTLLIQQLEAAGVEFDRRWGADRLAAVLAEAQKREPA